MSFLPPFRQPKTAGLGLAAAIALTLVWSCSSTEPPPPPPPDTTPAGVTPVTGTDNQTAVAGAAVATPPSVTVTNAAGTGLSGKSVTFAVTAGGGSVTGGTATTDAQGVATVGSWILGTTAGNNTLTATVGNVGTSFTAAGTAGPAASIVIEAGDGQSAPTGMPVAVAPSVKVGDANGNPVSGASVTFTPMNNSQVAGSPATTDASGIATVTSWTMGDINVANTLEASVAGVGAPVVFTAFSTGVPATITISAGDNQTTSAGFPVPTDPAVEVRDAGGALLEMITVNFAATQGGGSVDNATAMTDASGIATIRWTLGQTAGANVMEASVVGVGSPAAFNATGVAGPPTQIQITNGDTQSATVGAALANPVQATLQDQFGNGVQSVTLTFSPQAGGSVDNTTVTTDVNGDASVTWTLGTTAGNQTLDVTSAGVGITPAAANATANPDVATTMTVSAGDGQSAVQGTAVATAPAVLVEDQFNNPVPGVSVTFTPSGDGSVTTSPATSDASGIATPGSWTLATTAGANTLDASATGLTTVTFNATGIQQTTISSISPDPVVEGQSATITGTGFDPTPANNTVTFDGVAATVTSASATTLTVTVPTSGCLPARDVDVVVTVSASTSNTVSHAAEPGSFVTLAVGQQLILRSPSDLCLQFAASASGEQYLIGVQSTSETPSSLTPITLAAAASPSASPAIPLQALAAAFGGFVPQADERAIRWGKHRAAEAELRTRERRLLPMPPRGGGLASVASQIPPNVQVGDTVPIKFPDISPGVNFCFVSISITTVVRFIGTRGVWLEDVANPAGGYSAADYQSLSNQLDNPIYDKDVEYFGAPTDLDNNSRIGIVITQEVNKQGGLLGFVVGSDLVQPATCPSSNVAEIFYGIAPDPTGTLVFGVYPTATALADAPFLIAHEFTHIIQLSRRIAAGASTFLSSWEAEGQATLAEEVVGHAVEGRSVGTDIGFTTAFNLDDPNSVDWYSDAFFDMMFYFGWDGANGKVSGAPHECTWLDLNSGPCLGGRQVYGTPWSLLRWVSDQYGSSFPGGEQGIHQSLIGSSNFGYANLAGVVGVPIETLLAKWAATLYVDNRFTPTDPLLNLPSWDMLDIYGSLIPEAQLTPQTATFGNFSATANVRAGSTYYTLISGSSRPATAIRARDGSGGTLPAFVQYWIVRTQ